MLNKTRSFFRISSSFWNLSPYSLNFTTLPEQMNEETVTEKPSSIMSEKKNSRYNQRLKRREWEEYDEQNKRPRNEDFERIKKRKMAMLLGYSGINYYGMQRNPDIKTIEEELLKALLEVNYITQEAYEKPQTICFQRAARTDKGVSAATQVLSLKMREDIELSKINEKLPSDIRIFAIKRVTKGFNSKSNCDARTYCYVIPTYAFANHQIEINNITEYRTTTEIIDNINKILLHFRGTKNYHNFTSRKHYNDPSSRRYMIDFQCEQPFTKDNVEFAVFKVKGQSFMLHQIRKMIGLTLAILRGHTEESTMERAFSEDRIDLPMAPGLGLLLDQVHYDKYNKRYGGDGFHQTLMWEDVTKEVAEFKESVIFPFILETEMKELPMKSWLETLPYHSYDVREEDRVAEEGEDSDAEDAKNNQQDSTDKNGIVKPVQEISSN